VGVGRFLIDFSHRLEWIQGISIFYPFSSQGLGGEGEEVKWESGDSLIDFSHHLQCEGEANSIQSEWGRHVVWEQVAS